MKSSDILIINGSLREGGNTDALVSRIAAGARDGGAKVSLINLRKLDAGNCDGCWRCMDMEECALKDGISGVYGAMEKARLVVFASPMYWCGVTGIMKTLLDRLFLYYHPQNKRRIEGKKAVVVTTMNQKDEPAETKILAATYKIVFRCIGIKLEGMHFFTGLLEKDSARKNHAALKRAYDLGISLKNLI